MSDSVPVAVIGLVAGGLGGVATSLLTPWANWAVDKRKATREHHRQLIQSWREGLSAWESGKPRNQIEVPPGFLSSAW